MGRSFSTTIAVAAWVGLVGAKVFWNGRSGAPSTTTPSDYSAIAALGINLNQANGDPAPAPSVWLPSSSAGIAYSVTNPGGSPLRVQLQAVGGDLDPTLRWCANITAGTDPALVVAHITPLRDARPREMVSIDRRTRRDC
jgi:hypothetical protein